MRLKIIGFSGWIDFVGCPRWRFRFGISFARRTPTYSDEWDRHVVTAGAPLHDEQRALSPAQVQHRAAQSVGVREALPVDSENEITRRGTGRGTWYTLEPGTERQPKTS